MANHNLLSDGNEFLLKPHVSLHLLVRLLMCRVYRPTAIFTEHKRKAMLWIVQHHHKGKHICF